MDNKQGPFAEHRELCSKLHGCLDGRGVRGRMDTCICMAESLHCSPETLTTLLISYTPRQTKKLKKKKKDMFYQGPAHLLMTFSKISHLVH